MKLENQVCSLELSKKLKTLGVKQESYFYWSRPHSSKAYVLSTGYLQPWESADEEHAISAFTVAELGEMLPSEVATNKYTEPDVTTYMCKLHVEGDWSKYITITEANTEADARAKQLCYLLEKNRFNNSGYR